MRYHKDKNIITMSLVDLEHCGFSYQDFLGELFLSGIDDKAAEMPVMLAVDFIGGAVITTSTRAKTLETMENYHNKYMEYLEKLGIEND